MAEAARPRPVEYYNPRLLILGICFFWGVAIGFCMFYFAPPKQMSGEGGQNGSQQDVVPVATMTDQERRRLDMPDIATVEPTPETVQPATRLRIESMEMEPPAPVLTTDGGLTGRTARLPGRRFVPGESPASIFTAPAPPPRPVLTEPPPIPELWP